MMVGGARATGGDPQVEGTTHTAARYFAQVLCADRPDLATSTGLVVGCGDGHEADYLTRVLHCHAVGVDISPSELAAAGSDRAFEPVVADVSFLPFRDATFGFAFCHHMLEHVADPEKAVAEIARVLKPCGVLYIATPNRSRLLGYIGAYRTTLWQKALWNLYDYRDRFRARFDNSSGAHAGFSRSELERILLTHFPEVRWVTASYLRYKYSSPLARLILKVAGSDPLLRFAAPALHAICRK